MKQAISNIITALRASTAHLARHRELYLLPLLTIALSLAAIHAVNYVTGRPVVEDPGVIIGYAFNTIGIAVVLALTGFTQTLFFGFRGDIHRDGFNPLLKDDIFDGVVTICLLVIYSCLVFSLLD